MDVPHTSSAGVRESFSVCVLSVDREVIAEVILSIESIVLTTDKCSFLAGDEIFEHLLVDDKRRFSSGCCRVEM